MTSDDLRCQCQKAFTRLQELHGRARADLARNSEKLDLTFTRFDWIERPRPMTAIDGSYRKLWHDHQTNSSLFLFRAAALNYEFTDDEKLALVDVELLDRVVLLPTDTALSEGSTDLENKLTAALLDFAGRDPRDQSILISGYQRFFEQQLALKMAHEKQQQIITLDGALATLNVEPLRNQLHQLGKVIVKNDHWLIGVTKVNRTKTWNRIFTDEQVVSRQGPSDTLAFVPWNPPRIDWIARIGHAYFAYLHPKALKWFRVDIFPEEMVPKELFAALAQYAKDLRLPGYPIPLTEAHRACKMIRTTSVIPEHVLLESGLSADIPTELLLLGLLDQFERASGGFHERLDKMTK